MARGRQRWKKVLKWTAIVLGVLVVGVVLLVATLLWTPAGTRLALREALERYDAMIAGDIAVERIEGSVGGGLVLHGVTMRDRHGTPLVVAERVELQASPLALLKRDVDVDLLALEGVDVYLPTPGAPGFADLAPPPTVPEPPPEGLGPDLPVALDGTLRVRDLTVHQVGDSPLVAGLSLDGRVTAEGRRAHVVITEASAALPSSDLNVTSMAASVRWAEPWVEIDGLRVATDIGRVESTRLLANVATGRVVGRIEGTAPREALARRFGLDLPGDGRFAIRANGTPADLEASVRVDAGPASVDVEGTAALVPAPRVDARIEVAGVDPSRFAPVEPGNVGLRGRVRARGTELADLDASVDLACVDCRLEPAGPVALSIEGELRDGDGTARVALDAADTTVRAEVRVEDLERVEADFSVRAPHLGRLAEIAELETPVGGSVVASGRCQGPIASPECRVEATARNLRAADVAAERAEITATARPGETPMPVDARVEGRNVRWQGRTFPRFTATAEGTLDDLDVAVKTRDTRGDRLDAELEIQRVAPPEARREETPEPADELEEAGVEPDVAAAAEAATEAVDAAAEAGYRVRVKRLDTRIEGVDIRAEGPATLDLAGGRIRVDDLRLRLDGGLVRVDGTLAPDRPSDLSLRVDGLRLGALERFAPTLPVGGVLDAEGRVTGRAGAPRVTLSGRVADLVWDGRRLGTADVDVRYADGRLRAEAALRGGPAERLTLTAALPADLSLSPFRFALRRAGAIDGELVVAGLDLAEARRLFVPTAEAPPVGGVASATVSLNGTAAAPRATVEAALRRLVWNGLYVVDLGLDGRYVGGRLEARAALRGGPAERLALTVDAPVHVALSPFRFGVRPRGHLDAALDVRHLDLAALRRMLLPQAETLPVYGTLSTKLAVDGTPSVPNAALDLGVVGLAWQGRAVGDVALDGTYADGRAEATLALAGDLARRLEAHVEAPVTVRPLGEEVVTWRREAGHLATVDVEHLDLAVLKRWLPDLEATGVIDAHARAEGDPAAPRLDADVRGSAVAWQRRTFGDVRATLAYADGRAEADARLFRGEDRAVRVVASAPVEVDLLASRASWQAQGQHRLLVSAQGIDREFVSPFVTVRGAVGFWLNGTLQAEGNLDEFAANGRFDGEVRHPVLPRAMPLSLVLDADPRTQALALDVGDGRTRGLSLRAETRAPVPALRRGEADLAAVPITASLTAPGLPLAPLAAVVPTSLYEPEGTFVADVTATGTIGSPVLNGRLAIEDGAITLVDLNQRVQDLQVLLRMEGREFHLDTFRFASGRGRARGEADAVWGADGTITGDAELAMDDMPFQRPGMPLGQIDSRIETRFAFAPLLTDVEVEISRTTIELTGGRTRAPEPIPANSNVVYADELEKAPAAEAPPEPGVVQLLVNVDDPVRIFGRGFEMAWDGRIALRSVDGETTVRGGLQSTSGQIEALGNTLELESGLVTLTPDGDPFINVVAGTQVGSYSVNVALRGRASEPDLVLSSDPPLPEYQVLRMLVMGAPTGADEDPVQVQREAAALLATVNAPLLERQLGDRLGIDRLGVGFGESVDQPILTLGKRVNRDVYVETAYQFNAAPEENQTEVRVEYQLRPRWSLETRYGDAQEGSFDIVWRITFGGSPVLPDEQGPEPATVGARREPAKEDEQPTP